MPRFTVKIPNDDEGEDLGEYESDYLPRVGDSFALWHPRVCKDRDVPFLGVVHAVTHEAHCAEYLGATPQVAARGRGAVSTLVWLIEEHAPPARYCDCSPKEREQFEVEDGLCGNCRGLRTA